MADISLIELFVYGFVAYSSLLMLIISTIKEVPTTKALSISRAIYLIPGMIAAALLAQVGPNIITTSVSNTITALNTSEVFQEVITTEMELQNEVWAIFHYMIFIVLFIYIISQILILLTHVNEKDTRGSLT